MVVRILSCAASRSVSTQEQLSESLAAFVRAAVTASLQSLPRMIITSPIKAVSNAPSLQDRCPSPPSPPLTLVLAQSCHTVQAKESAGGAVLAKTSFAALRQGVNQQPSWTCFMFVWCCAPMMKSDC